MEWDDLMTKLGTVDLTATDDKVVWKLEHSGKFSLPEACTGSSLMQGLQICR